MLDAIIAALATVWDQLLQWISALASWALGLVFANFPAFSTTEFTNSRGTIAFAVSAANAWVPIDYAIALFLGVITFIIVYWSIKILLNMIP